MNHDVAYFGPEECLYKHTRYLRYKMEKPRKLNTRQYVVLVRDLNSRMAQLPPLFHESQKIDESELVDSWRLVGERVDQFRIINFLNLPEEVWHLSHP